MQASSHLLPLLRTGRAVVERLARVLQQLHLIVILTALVVGFLAVIWAFIREAGERARQNPKQASRLDALRGYLRWR